MGRFLIKSETIRTQPHSASNACRGYHVALLGGILNLARA
jgi:hypothetical protein